MMMDRQEDDNSTLISEELSRSRRKDLATETMRKTLMAMGDDVTGRTYQTCRPAAQHAHTELYPRIETQAHRERNA